MKISRMLAAGVLGGGGLRNLSLNFATGSGLGALVGSTWATDGTKAVNTPGLGAELWDANAATFESTSTYAWVAQGTNTLANAANALTITYVDNTAGAKEMLNNAADLAADLTIGQFYRMGMSTKMNTGSCNVRLYDGANTNSKWTEAATSLTPHVTTFLALHASNAFTQQSSLSAGEVLTIDDLSLKQITLANTSAVARFAGPYGTVKAGWNSSSGTLCGVWMCLDNPASPLNGVLAVRDISVMMLLKLVNGTWTTLLNTSSTYAAGGVVEIRHLSGDTFGMYYNNVQVGTDQTITGMTGKYHGLFSTDSVAQALNFFFTASVADPMNILMIGDSKTTGFGSVYQRLFAPPNEFEETPTRMATSGYTAHDWAAGIDAALVVASGTPAHILINLGANDVVALPSEAAWKADMNYIIDALNVKYPGVPCYMMRAWKRGEAADCNTLATWIADIVAVNSLARLGPDERVFLENGDDGATYTSDGTHPNDAGYALTGRKWLTAMGY